MFMFVTIFSVWSVIFLGNALLEYPIAAHSSASFVIFWPFALQGWSSSLLLGLWLLWLIALFTLLLKILLTRRNAQSLLEPHQKKEPFLLALGMPGNIRIFDLLLIAFCLLLTLFGWAFGHAAPLLIGILATLGLLGNRLEQSFSQ